jgi:putative endonuclease
LTSARSVVGANAETLALEMLERRGLQCIVRNFRCRAGEIDLIMLDRSVLVFVEVRFRQSDKNAALMSVNRAKQRRLRRAAQVFLLERPALGRRACRFDVVAVSGAGGEAPEMCWIEDAFAPG